MQAPSVRLASGKLVSLYGPIPPSRLWAAHLPLHKGGSV